VDDGTTRLWLDAGAGTLAQLQTHIEPGELDAIVLSHEHPDHWSDLEGWHNVLRFVLVRHGFPVYAPHGLRERTYEDMGRWVAWHEVADGDRVSVGSVDLTFSQTDHGPETLGVRVDAQEPGASLGYSADTGPNWSLEALGEGLDLALCEATVPSSLEGMMQHLSARQAGEQARGAKVKQLVLTHLWPTLDADRARREGSEAFGAEVDLAELGRRYEL
jgi:ribonuclease BN (tRNA processing enzyme)